MALFIASPSFAEEASPAAAAPTLKIGSPAPAVKFGPFFKGEEVRTLDPERSYILECWATWCAPCLSSIPHMSEIARATEGKVTVIGVNVCDRPSPARMAELLPAMGYAVTIDADACISKNWMSAAGERGIPLAFVVVKGRIAWFGPPSQLDGDIVVALVAGRISGTEIRRAREIELKVQVGKLAEAATMMEELLKVNREAAPLVKKSKALLDFKKLALVDSRAAVEQLLAVKNSREFFDRGLYLASNSKIQLAADDFLKLDAATAEKIEIASIDPHDKFWLVLLRGKLRAAQGDFSGAADFLQTAKAKLEPIYAQRLNEHIAKFRTRAEKSPP
ncbi:MAG: hypothetical protein RL095_3690 [Verrucomicrobiota bacterium]